MAASDEREHESASIADDGRRFRVFYTPDIHDPRWFTRSFVIGPDGSPTDVREYPERFFAGEGHGERRTAQTVRDMPHNVPQRAREAATIALPRSMRPPPLHTC